jgi:BirA family transcriptional regulator, biotin operon repressor / biotin---[acetyl-CoA-carboxylase] ligase
VTASGGFLSRHERLRSVTSTNDIVRTWLAEGTPEVCLAVADEQTAGRGRAGRTWTSNPGSALTLSLGFRPSYLEPATLWRLPAVVALAMADAAEEQTGLPMGMLRLKWPNDIVVVTDTGVRKIAGILSESEGAGSDAVTAVVGIGVNTDWAARDFPADLAGSMTSLREASRGRPIDNGELLVAFLLHLEPRLLALRDGHFDVAGWHDRQVTTGRTVRIDMPDGTALETRAVGVDGLSGGLLVEDAAAPGGERELLVGEIVHVRFGSARRGKGRLTVPSGGRPGGSGDPAAGPGVTN